MWFFCEWEEKTPIWLSGTQSFCTCVYALGRDGPARGLRVLVHHGEAQGRAQVPGAGRSEDLLVGPSDSTLAREKEMNVSHNIRDLGKCFTETFKLCLRQTETPDIKIAPTETLPNETRNEDISNLQNIHVNSIKKIFSIPILLGICTGDPQHKWRNPQRS